MPPRLSGSEGGDPKRFRSSVARDEGNVLTKLGNDDAPPINSSTSSVEGSSVTSSKKADGHRSQTEHHSRNRNNKKSNSQRATSFSLQIAAAPMGDQALQPPSSSRSASYPALTAQQPSKSAEKSITADDIASDDDEIPPLSANADTSVTTEKDQMQDEDTTLLTPSQSQRERPSSFSTPTIAPHPPARTVDPPILSPASSGVSTTSRSLSPAKLAPVRSGIKIKHVPSPKASTATTSLPAPTPLTFGSSITASHTQASTAPAYATAPATHPVPNASAPAYPYPPAAMYSDGSIPPPNAASRIFFPEDLIRAYVQNAASYSAANASAAAPRRPATSSKPRHSSSSRHTSVSDARRRNNTSSSSARSSMAPPPTPPPEFVNADDYITEDLSALETTHSLLTPADVCSMQPLMHTAIRAIQGYNTSSTSPSSQYYVPGAAEGNNIRYYPAAHLHHSSVINSHLTSLLWGRAPPPPLGPLIANHKLGSVAVKDTIALFSRDAHTLGIPVPPTPPLSQDLDEEQQNPNVRANQPKPKLNLPPYWDHSRINGHTTILGALGPVAPPIPAGTPMLDPSDLAAVLLRADLRAMGVYMTILDDTPPPPTLAPGALTTDASNASASSSASASASAARKRRRPQAPSQAGPQKTMLESYLDATTFSKETFPFMSKRRRT